MPVRTIGATLLTVLGSAFAADVATAAVEKIKDTVTGIFARREKKESNEQAEDEG